MSATRGLDIVCFSANDWNDIPSSKFHIMRYLGERNRILFVDTIGIRTPRISRYDIGRLAEKGRAIAAGVRHVAPSIYVLSPPAIPFHGSQLAGSLNERVVVSAVRGAMRRIGMDAPVIWSYLPHAAPIIRRLPRSAVVYHCIDDYGAFSDAPTEALLAFEKQMCQLADLAAASSVALAERCAEEARHTVFVPHGVNAREFEERVTPQVSLPDIDNLPRPRAGFVGRVGDWVDVRLIAATAEALPDWMFPIIGPINSDIAPLQRISNVHFLGRKPYEEIPNYIDRLDVGLMPYRGARVRETANPLKLYEYLALGKPVVGTKARELDRFGSLLHVADAADFASAIVRAAATDSSDSAAARRAAVIGRSWGDVAEEILTALGRIEEAASA